MEGRWFQDKPPGSGSSVTSRRSLYTPRNRRSASSRKGQNSNPDNITVADIYIHFVENTQIPWVYYISSRQKVWKYIWVIVIVGGIGVAFIQSKTAFKGYTGYDVSLQTTYKLNSTLPFPAVTVCTNTPISWLNQENSNSSIYQDVMSRRNDENERKKYESKFKKKGKPYEEFILFDVLRKSPQQPITYGPVQSIVWDGTKYTLNGTAGNSFKDLESRKIVKLMHDMYYGDCFTFNAGVDDEEQFQASALTGITIQVDWDAKDRYPELNDPAIVIVVHPAAVAPTFGDGNNFKVYPKDQVTVGVKVKEIKRMPSPYPSHCVPSERYPIRANSAYYSEERQFIYNIDACINTCIQRLSLDICGCWDYQIPVGLLRQEPKFPSASICASRCSKIDQVLNIDRCKCNLPCKEIALDLSYSVISNLVTEIIKNDLGGDDKNLSVTTAAPPSQKTTIRVFLKTSMFEYSNEVPKYTVADFLGIVGGNAAFWTGISAVSLFELVELLYQLCKYHARRWHRKHILKLPASAVSSMETFPLPYRTAIIRIPKIMTRPDWKTSKFSYTFHPHVIITTYRDQIKSSVSKF